MPAEAYSNLVFVVGLVVLVSILSLTSYVMAINMISDAYRYEKALEVANEKLRLVGVIAPPYGLVYGVRNIGSLILDVKELGVVSQGGARVVLKQGLRLMPGEYVVDTLAWPYGPGYMYAVTGRGSVFVSPIYRIPSGSTYSLQLRDLRPLFIYQNIDPGFEAPVDYMLQFSAYAYVFGYIAASSWQSIDNTYIQFGPYSVADLFKNGAIPYSVSKSESFSRLYVSATFWFSIERDGSGATYYRVSMPVYVGGYGRLTVHGCLGIVWRTITNTFFPIARAGAPGSYSSSWWVRDGQGSEGIYSGVLPSSLNVQNIVPAIEKSHYNLPTSAPSGTQVYLLVLRCFKVDGSFGSFSTSLDNPVAYVQGGRVITELKYPYYNYGQSGQVYVGPLGVDVAFDPRIYVKFLLAYF